MFVYIYLHIHKCTQAQTGLEIVKNNGAEMHKKTQKCKTVFDKIMSKINF